MQARRIARELALLGMGQLPSKPQKLSNQDLEKLISAAVRSLLGEVQDVLERASGDLQQGQERLLESETRTSDLAGAKAMVQDAIAATQKAINYLGSSVQIPELIQVANQKEVRSYTIELLSNIAHYKADVDSTLDQVMVAWQMKRLAQIDRDLLRLAIVEIAYLGVPDRVAINEAVELAKRYSDEDGYRFVNGVLRRWLQHTQGKGRTASTAPSSSGEVPALSSTETAETDPPPSNSESSFV
jgi:N utilization substance protein B